MESVLGRYRNLTILVGVLFLQVLGLAVQVKRSADAENTRLIRIWAVSLVTPLERGLIWAQNGSRNLWHNYFFLRGVRAENRGLKEQIEQMRLEQVRLNEDAAQAHRLQALLAFKEQYIAKTVAAQVIGSSGSDLSRSIYIDKGSNDGVGADMAVITSGGIVGKVLRVYPSTSLVLMINDQSSGVGAMLEKSRLQGVLHGTGNGEVVLERVMSDEQVVPGETVLSSGGDQIFPKGLTVGTVSKVSPGKEMFLNILVKPAADLSRLEEVLVVTQKQVRETAAVSTGKVRAADILAQRLPSVPDKPPADGGTAAGGSASAPRQSTTPGDTPQPNAAHKPDAATASGNMTSLPGSGQASSNKAAPNAAGLAVAGPSTAADTLKKVVQKTSGSDSAPSRNSASAPASGATAPGTTPSGPKASGSKTVESTPVAATSPSKRPAPQTKPVTRPQPPPPDDTPH